MGLTDPASGCEAVPVIGPVLCKQRLQALVLNPTDNVRRQTVPQSANSLQGFHLHLRHWLSQRVSLLG